MCRASRTRTQSLTARQEPADTEHCVSFLVRGKADTMNKRTRRDLPAKEED